MRRIWRVVGGGISVKSYDDSTWEGDRDTSAMEQPGRGDWASEFQDDLPGKGRPAELPGGGMPGQIGNKDENAGAIPAPACPRHHGYYGGGKLPPPMVRPMRHAGPQAVPERTAPGHGTVYNGRGEEETTARGGGDEGEFGAGLQGIRGTYK